jgi:hypothetical protein
VNHCAENAMVNESGQLGWGDIPKAGVDYCFDIIRRFRRSAQIILGFSESAEICG